MMILLILVTIFLIVMIMRRKKNKKNKQKGSRKFQVTNDNYSSSSTDFKNLSHSGEPKVLQEKAMTNYLAAVTKEIERENINQAAVKETEIENPSFVELKEKEGITSSLLSIEEPKKEETVFQQLAKLKIDSISFNIKENSRIKKIINAMRREGYFESDYEGMSNKEIKEDGIYDLAYYEIYLEFIPKALIYRDMTNDHKFLIKAGLDQNELSTIGEIPKELSEHFYELINNPFSIEVAIEGGKYKTLDEDNYGNDKVYIRNSPYELHITIIFYEPSANELTLPKDALIKTVPYDKVKTNKKHELSNEILPGIKLDAHLINHSNTRSSHNSEYIKARKLTDSFVVIDFETTGLKVADSEIIQIGAIYYVNGEIINTFSSYVKPTSSSLSPTITRITGITMNTLTDAPTLENILPKFLTFIGGLTLVAHNASFDMKFLLSAIDRCGIVMEKFRVIDTLTLSRRLFDGMPNYKLETLKKQLNLGDQRSHNALEDCYTTGSLYMTCLRKTQSSL